MGTERADEIALLRAPIEDSYSLTEVAWTPGKDQAPAMTGDRDNPARWVAPLLDEVFSDQSDFGGGREVLSTFSHAIFIEPVAVGLERRAREVADALETAYAGKDSGGLHFRVQQSLLVRFGEDDGWERWDWNLPVRRFRT